MNSPEATLTICIPTYNRSNILETVQALLPQITGGVLIKIFDNCSDVPVSEILKDYPSLSIDIIRNKVNVGAAGNIIKCFELCETEWMWLLGDDDQPKPTAVETILRTINLNSESVFIKFNSNLGRVEDNVTHDTISIGQTQFIENTNNFSNLLFISSTVCKVSELNKFIRSAYYFAHTFSPHLAFLFAYLRENDDAITLLSPLNVVEWQHPSNFDTWDYKVVNKSLSEFVYTIKDNNAKKLLFAKINRYAPFVSPFQGMNKLEIIKTIIYSKGKIHEHDIIADYFSVENFVYWTRNDTTLKRLFNSFMMNFLFLFLYIPGISDVIKMFVKTKPNNFSYLYNRYSSFIGDKRL